jgi:hypothetical protein
VPDRIAENTETRKSRPLTNTAQDQDEPESARPTKKQRPNSSVNENFACPFYKKSPKDHQHCARLVLSKISYVKQHLIRKHSAKEHCPKCFQIFAKGSEVINHLANSECQPKPRPAGLDGITLEKRELLVRRSELVGSTKEDRWFEIWDILFTKNATRPRSIYVDLDLPPEVNEFMDYMTVMGTSRLKSLLVDNDAEPANTQDQNPDPISNRIAKLLQEIQSEWKKKFLERVRAESRHGCPLDHHQP